MMIDAQTLFERRMAYPDPTARDRLGRLVGLDDHKDRLRKILALLVHPRGLARWSEKHHPGASLLLDTVLNRPPLVILAGDVGSGRPSSQRRSATRWRAMRGSRSFCSRSASPRAGRAAWAR
jgi:hypothetical protein